MEVLSILWACRAAHHSSICISFTSNQQAIAKPLADFRSLCHICLLMLQKYLLSLNSFVLCIWGTEREEQLMVAKLWPWVLLTIFAGSWFHSCNFWIGNVRTLVFVLLWAYLEAQTCAPKRSRTWIMYVSWYPSLIGWKDSPSLSHSFSGHNFIIEFETASYNFKILKCTLSKWEFA